MRALSYFLFALLVACSTSGEAMQARRVMPPASLDCDRNELTSFTGEVSDYQRSDDAVQITIDTDDGTTETFTISVDDDGWSGAFLVNGQPAEDALSIIEDKNGTLKAGMRVIAWVCGDADVTLDWRPARL